MGKKLIYLWLIVAVVAGAMLAIARLSLTAQDDPDQAYQRPGFLIEANTLAPALMSGYPRLGNKTVVIFNRKGGNELSHDLSVQSAIDQQADIILISQDGVQPKITNGIDLILADPNGQYATAYGLRTPIDKGYPVGYAVIDRDNFIRYRTLDPEYHNLVDEITTVLRAIP